MQIAQNTSTLHDTQTWSHREKGETLMTWNEVHKPLMTFPHIINLTGVLQGLR